MLNERVLISGAGIAGPALARWLHRFGFRPTDAAYVDLNQALLDLRRQGPIPDDVMEKAKWGIALDDLSSASV